MACPPRLDPDRLGRAVAVVRESVQRGEAPAAVLAVANSRETVCCEAFTRPGGDIVAADTIFLLASISKPILATAVLQLAEEGQLVLSEPVARYIPELATPATSSVTAWHLLTHTSGIAEVTWPETVRQRPAVAVGLDPARRMPLRFVPGARFAYSTLSFYLLAELITRLGGQPYPEYLRERIFAPLAMADTSFDPRAAGARVAPVHGIDPDGALGDEEAVRYFISLAMPGAGLWSTAADLVAFGQAMLNDGQRGDGRLLSPPFMELMTRDHTGSIATTTKDEPSTHYGLGWYKRSLEGWLPGSPRVFEHGGATGCRLWIDPDWDLVYVYLTNGFNLDSHAQVAALQAVYGAFVG